MLHNWALLLFLALIQTAPPDLSARWDDPGVATVQWTQPAGVGMTCLYRQYGAEWPAGICWRDLSAGEQTVELPGMLADVAYLPDQGDRYELRFENIIVGSVVLGEATVYRLSLPLVQNDARPPDRRVRLPLIRV